MTAWAYRRADDDLSPAEVYTSTVTDTSVDLTVSTGHAARIAVAESWIAEQAAHGPVLVVAPTQRAADDLARSAARDVRGMTGVERATPLRLANLWAAPALAKAGRTRLSGLAAEAMAVRAIHRTKMEAALEYFGPVEHFAGFGRAVARTLLELRRAEVRPESLETEARGRDLARLMRAFEDELTRLGLVDTAGLLSAAIEAGPARDATEPPATLIIDAIPAFAADRRWLSAIAKSSRTARFLGADLDEAVVGNIAGSVERLLGVTATPIAEANDGSLRRAQRQIFATETTETTDVDDTLRFFSAPGEARECVEIARQIRAEAGNGRRFDRMAVLLPRPEAYGALIEDALRRAGVPAFSTARARRPLPAGRALLALLACASENLAAGRFAEYLSLGQVPRLTEDGIPPADPVAWVAPKDDRQLSFASRPAPPADPDLPPESDESAAPAGHLQTPLRWERLLVDAQVRAGASERWQRRLEGYEAELRLQLRRLDDDQDAARAKRRADLRSLKLLMTFALPLIAALEELPSSAPWAKWLSVLHDLATRALREPEPVLRVLAELAPMGDVGPVSLREVRQVLHPRLAFLSEEPEGHRFGKVFVAPIEEAAARAFDVVFLPGLAQGVFPGPVFEDPLLLDEQRAHIAEGLSVGDRQRAHERRRLRWAIGAATERLVASYPRIDVLNGRPRVPSFYAFDLLRAACGQFPALSELEHNAAAATDSQWGWPAPSNPVTAIDHSEFDLAVLGPHIFEPADAIRGHGRYLLDVGAGRPDNAYLVRALFAEARRWRPSWTYADGLVVEQESERAALALHHPTARPYSATALQHFSECPYRFALQAVFRLRARDPVAPVEDLDPLTRGALFHEVQFHFLQRVRRDGPMSPQIVERARGWLDEAHTRVAGIWRDRLAPPIDAVWDKAMDNMRIDLHGWLTDQLEQDPWQPVHAELAFGLSEQDDESRDPDSTSEPVRILDRYLLRGAIDLVEAHADTGILRVTDHKTGRAIDRSLVHIGGGKHLQPLLYGLAAEALLARPIDEGRLSYCTRRGGFAVRKVAIDDEGRAAVKKMYATLESAFDGGFFPAAPNKGACTWCDYRRLCGPFEEQRVRMKQGDRLAELESLRKTP